MPETGTYFHRSVIEKIVGIQNVIRGISYDIDGYPSASKVYWSTIPSITRDLSAANVLRSSEHALVQAREVARETVFSLIEELDLRNQHREMIGVFKTRTKFVKEFYKANRALYRLAAGKH